MQTVTRLAANLLIAVATAVGILAIAIPFFLNPVFVAFEQGRAEATAWTGFSEAQLRVATDAILADLVIGPPAFAVIVDGTPVLNDRERAHMRDVRTVFMGFFGAAVLLAGAAIVVARMRGGDALGRARTFGAVRAGAIGLIVGLVGLGLAAFVAFDVLFEIFHRIFFSGGSYTFDPGTERLVQLFPFRFWQETSVAVGAVAVAFAAVVAIVAGRRARDAAVGMDQGTGQIAARAR